MLLCKVLDGLFTVLFRSTGKVERLELITILFCTKRSTMVCYSLFLSNM